MTRVLSLQHLRNDDEPSPLLVLSLSSAHAGSSAKPALKAQEDRTLCPFPSPSYGILQSNILQLELHSLSLPKLPLVRRIDALNQTAERVRYEPNVLDRLLSDTLSAEPPIELSRSMQVAWRLSSLWMSPTSEALPMGLSQTCWLG